MPFAPHTEGQGDPLVHIITWTIIGGGVLWWAIFYDWIYHKRSPWRRLKDFWGP